MVNLRKETHIVLETVMEVQSYVISADNQLSLKTCPHLHLPQNVPEDQPQRLLHLRRGKVLCRVITAISIGISTAWIPLFLLYLPSTRNGCVRIMLKGLW